MKSWILNRKVSDEFTSMMKQYQKKFGIGYPDWYIDYVDENHDRLIMFVDKESKQEYIRTKYM